MKERTEIDSHELVISVELKQLDGAISEIESASQDFVNRVAPVLFFGPEKACTVDDSPSPPGSEIARELFQLRERLRHTVAFLRNMGQKVNL